MEEEEGIFAGGNGSSGISLLALEHGRCDINFGWQEWLRTFEAIAWNSTGAFPRYHAKSAP